MGIDIEFIDHFNLYFVFCHLKIATQI